MNVLDKTRLNFPKKHRLPTVCFIVGVVLAAVSVFLAYIYGGKETWEKIVYTLVAELGFAFAIAAIIIWTVDLQQKEEFEAEVKRNEKRFAARNLLAYLTDLDMPVSLSERLEGYLSNSSFIRKHAHISIELIPVSKGWVNIVYVISYEAFNATRNPEQFVHQFYIDLIQGLPEKFSNLSGLNQVNIDYKAPGDSNFRTIADKQFEIGKMPKSMDEFSHDKLIVAPNGIVRVRGVMHSVRRESDAEVFQNLMITENATIAFKFDKKKFNVEWRCIHPQLISAKPKETSDGLLLNADTPMLAGNGIFINWHPR